MYQSCHFWYPKERLASFWAHKAGQVWQPWCWEVLNTNFGSLWYIFYICYFCFSTFHSNCSNLIKRLDLHISNHFQCISLFYMCLEIRIPAGFAIDKYGAKGVLQLGVLMSLLSLGLMATSSGFATQLLARVVLGAATSAAWFFERRRTHWHGSTQRYRKKNPSP